MSQLLLLNIAFRLVQGFSCDMSGTLIRNQTEWVLMAHCLHSSFQQLTILAFQILRLVLVLEYHALVYTSIKQYSYY